MQKANTSFTPNNDYIENNKQYNRLDVRICELENGQKRDFNFCSAKFTELEEDNSVQQSPLIYLGTGKIFKVSINGEDVTINNPDEILHFWKLQELNYDFRPNITE